jgi:hypothetical protein
MLLLLPAGYLSWWNTAKRNGSNVFRGKLVGSRLRIAEEADAEEAMRETLKKRRNDPAEQRILRAQCQTGSERKPLKKNRK